MGLTFSFSLSFRRFLRARRFDVEGAWGQFKDTEDWRKENAIEALYANIGIDSYEAARRMVCAAALGTLHLQNGIN
jgi:hypothetical protein